MKSAQAVTAPSSFAAGYSLIEFLVALTLFSFAAALSGAALVEAQRSSVRARELQRALLVASNALEALRAFGTVPVEVEQPGLRLRSTWQAMSSVPGLFEAAVEVESDLWPSEPIRLRTIVWRRENP